MEKSEVQRRFTTTIPKRVREKLGLKEGTGLFWEVEAGRMIVYPASYSSLDGILRGKVEYTRRVKEEVERQFIGKGKD
jgi:AbrB family looped-hinge helix DNA binding protein